MHRTLILRMFTVQWIQCFRSLREEGIGAEVRHASLISKVEENLLWDKGVLGIHCPLQLLRAVFYLNGKVFCLRGGKEHRNLKISQLVRHHGPDHYTYTENESKNRSGGLKQMKVENKVVPVYACSQAGVRCHVKLLDLYLSKLPDGARQKDIFIADQLLVLETVNLGT